MHAEVFQGQHAQMAIEQDEFRFGRVDLRTVKTSSADQAFDPDMILCSSNLEVVLQQKGEQITSVTFTE